MQRIVDMNWEMYKNCNGYYMSLYLMDEKSEVSDEKMKQLDFGFIVRHKDNPLYNNSFSFLRCRRINPTTYYTTPKQ